MLSWRDWFPMFSDHRQIKLISFFSVWKLERKKKLKNLEQIHEEKTVKVKLKNKTG